MRSKAQFGSQSSLQSNTHMAPVDLALILLVIGLWGVNFAVIKVGLVGVPPFLLGALRFMLAAFPMLLFFKAPKLPLRLYVLYGMVISVGQFAFLFTAIRVGMPTGLASLVLQSQAFFTMFFASIWLKEHWHAHQLLGLILAALGLVLIGSAHGVSMPLLGFLLTVAAASMWACGNIVTRSISRYAPFNQFAFVVWASAVPPIPFLLLSLTLEGPDAIATALRDFSWTSFAAIAYLAWVATLVGYGLWTRFLGRYPANRIAPFTMLVPLVGLTTGWVVFGEVLQPIHFAGGALLMLGLLVNVFGASWMVWLGQARGWLRGQF